MEYLIWVVVRLGSGTTKRHKQSAKKVGVGNLLGNRSLQVIYVAAVAIRLDVIHTAALPGQAGVLNHRTNQTVAVKSGSHVFSNQGCGENLVRCVFRNLACIAGGAPEGIKLTAAALAPTIAAPFSNVRRAKAFCATAVTTSAV